MGPRDPGTGSGPGAGELHLGGFDQPVEVRLAEMDAWGVDVQVVTPNVGFYQYTNELDVTCRIARECNDEICREVAGHPDRFAGMATVPMQDVPSAVAELERAMGDLGRLGASSGSAHRHDHHRPGDGRRRLV